MMGIGTCFKGVAMFSFPWGRGLVALVLFANLSACTFLRPPEPYLPRYSSIEPGETITVKGKENIYVIAHAHNVSMREIIVLNHLKAPFDVRPGQRLVLPAGGTGFGGDEEPPESSPLEPVDRTSLAPIMPAAVSSEELEPPPDEPARPAAMTNLKTSALPEQKPAVEAMVVVEPTPTAEIDTIDVSTTMRWPVQGPILSNFGAKGSGMRNDGINIGAPKGAPVVAAAPGTVVYVGNDMKGFGNMILIKHQGEMVTAYSHLDRILAKKDAIIAQGDMIGTVGKTGNVATPQLHFEVRMDGKPVDPSRAIRKTM
jgi:murein DD-endopeptidase MepM/ murein hydrolase activator NlpD